MSGNTHLATALHAFQKDAPPIHLDATNPHFRSKFASLGNVVSAVRPILNKHGLVYAQFPTNIDGAPALETMLIHAESGEDIAAVTPLILAKNDPQGYGSALTYARRYALLSILGLVGDEDDDANSASDPHGFNQSRADAAPPPKPENIEDTRIHFGKNEGKRLGDLTERQLAWYAETWEPGGSAADSALKEAAVAIHDLNSVPF